MTTFKIDTFTITSKIADGSSDYELLVHIWRNNIVMAGTKLRTDSKEVDVLEYAVNKIKEINNH